MGSPRFAEINPISAKTWMVVPGDWRRPETDRNFEILWDASRSFGQIWPRLDRAEISASYEMSDYYTHQKPGQNSYSTPGIGQRIMTKLAWWLDWGVDPAKSWWADQFDGQKLKILEVGCGNGGQLAILRSLGHDVTGIEPDPQAARLARDAGFTVHDGTAEDLPADLAQGQV